MSEAATYHLDPYCLCHKMLWHRKSHRYTGEQTGSNAQFLCYKPTPRGMLQPKCKSAGEQPSSYSKTSGCMRGCGTSVKSLTNRMTNRMALEGRESRWSWSEQDSLEVSLFAPSLLLFCFFLGHLHLLLVPRNLQLLHLPLPFLLFLHHMQSSGAVHVGIGTHICTFHTQGRLAIYLHAVCKMQSVAAG